MDKIEQIAKAIETENDFDKLVEHFGTAAGLVKDAVKKAGSAKGKITEIVRDVDGFIEKELKLGGSHA
jgi:hypothetical protein